MVGKLSRKNGKGLANTQSAGYRQETNERSLEVAALWLGIGGESGDFAK